MVTTICYLAPSMVLSPSTSWSGMGLNAGGSGTPGAAGLSEGETVFPIAMLMALKRGYLHANNVVKYKLIALIMTVAI